MEDLWIPFGEQWSSKKLGGVLFWGLLELLEEVASRAGDVDSAGDAALTVLDALYDSCGLGALGAIGALVCIHDLGAVTCLGNFSSHNESP